MTDKEIGKIAFDKFGLQECDEEYTYFVLGYKEAIKKQFAITDVVRSFLVKEAKSLGIEVNDLYLNLFDDKLYLNKVETESYYFELEDVREVE